MPNRILESIVLPSPTFTGGRDHNDPDAYVFPVWEDWQTAWGLGRVDLVKSDQMMVAS